MRYAGSKYTTKADAEVASRYPSARNYGNEYLMTSSSSMMVNRLGCNAGLSLNQLAGCQMANAINQASNYGQFAGQALQNQAAGSSSQLGSKSQGSLDLLIGSLFGL